MKNQHFRVAIMQRVKMPIYLYLTCKANRFKTNDLAKFESAY